MDTMAPSIRTTVQRCTNHMISGWNSVIPVWKLIRQCRSQKIK